LDDPLDMGKLLFNKLLVFLVKDLFWQNYKFMLNDERKFT
jgi:hypothetical protein